MTRFAMVVDVDRCVGCQTCAAACKHANATAVDVQWRKVVDFETGVYPQVRRTLSGWGIILIIITHAAINQGYAMPHSPARGAGTPGPGVKPGWTIN